MMSHPSSRKLSQAERRLSVYRSETFARLIGVLTTFQRFDAKRSLAEGFRTWLFATNQGFREGSVERARRCVAALKGSRVGHRSLRDIDSRATE